MRPPFLMDSKGVVGGRMSNRLSEDELKKEIRNKHDELMHLMNLENQLQRSRDKNREPIIAI